MKKNKNIGWGLFYIILAVLLILSRVGPFAGFGFFRIALSIIMLPVIWFGITKKHFESIFFPLAAICIMFSEELRLESLTPFQIIMTALLLSIGFSLLFPKKRKNHINVQDNAETIGGENVFIWARFGESIKYVNSDNLKQVNIESTCASVKVYLDKANVCTDNKAFVNITSTGSNVELFIPKSWKLQNLTECMGSNVTEKGDIATEKSDITITLQGKIRGSSFTIFYI